MKITKEMVFESVKKKRNWSSPGDDKITNYWIKRVNVFHQDIATALNVIIENRLELSTMLFSLPLRAFPLRFVCVPFRDGPLIKLSGEWGIFEPQELFFVIKFLV